MAACNKAGCRRLLWMEVPHRRSPPILVFADNIVVDATSIYWTEDPYSAGEVKKLPFGGGIPVVLASGSKYEGESGGIAVDATDVYWTNWSAGTVMKVTRKRSNRRHRRKRR